MLLLFDDVDAVRFSELKQLPIFTYELLRGKRIHLYLGKVGIYRLNCTCTRLIDFNVPGTRAEVGLGCSKSSSIGIDPRDRSLPILFTRNGQNIDQTEMLSGFQSID